MKKTIALTLGLAMLTLLPSVAAATTGLIPFGGNVMWTIPCTCSGNVLVYVGPPNFGSFMYQPTIPGIPAGTDVFMNYLPMKVGSYVLGLAEPAPMTCLVYAGVSCVTAGAGGMMLTVGTSL